MARYIDGDKLKGLMRLDKSGIEYKLKHEMLHWERKLECKAYLDAIEYCVKQINEAPTADVAEVRHGHWIHKVKRYPYQPDDCEAVCSVCGMDYALDPEYTIKYFAMHNKFCPNCGARMDGDAE